MDGSSRRCGRRTTKEWKAAMESEMNEKTVLENVSIWRMIRDCVDL
jgi:hypothetical protein